jgi:thymidylate synthase (FAD)
MDVKLISKPDMNAVSLCEHAAAMCTQTDKPAQALRAAMRSGHDSVLEHASFTFEIRGVSRVLLAQLTRHRIASFTVLSQRYVDQSNREYVMPTTIQNNDDLRDMYAEAISSLDKIYEAFIRRGVPKEDARYLLPQAITTDLILTMNARELGHFFSLRCCNRAQAEIRLLADEMLKLLVKEFPELFKNAGPGCIRGACPEARPCGHPRKAEEWRE